MIATLAYMAVSGVGAAVVVGAMVELRAQTQRTAELKRSGALLSHHMDSLERFCENDEVPEELKVSLLHLSGAFDDKEFVIYLAHCIRDAQMPDTPTNKFSDSIQRLSADGRDLLSTSFRSGLTGAILRWRETAPCYQVVADWLAHGPESAEVRRAIRESERFESRRRRRALEPVAA